MSFTSLIKATIVVVCLFGSRIGQAQNLSVYRSEADVDETVNRLVAVIEQDADLIFFETVHHDDIARERGLKLAPTRSILFEDPTLTTQLINCQQTAALDLPLEILVWEEHGDVYIGFVDPKFMKRRFMITSCDDTIQALSRLMVKVTMDAIRKL
ncbi:DUF302 domain-containing protein [Marinoscillum furvescens]|uniref:Uncharacterized protein (DUF302 family) n=1 Tax=Marinoscillum furvescens DSM 4134 TaxID=1122208 RepID=A0A3D9L918_MARFU|nr:DUF302 domain-containing protein [Marinoscillum furvescens]REE02174.1 uncharacterized protein (DUF302 family) [Marinoscillum furvescens DSM 4134]